MDLEQLHGGIALKTAETLEAQRVEAERRQAEAERSRRIARRRVGLEKRQKAAEGVMAGWRTLVAHMAPMDATSTIMTSYMDADRELAEARKADVDIVVNMGPLRDPAEIAKLAQAHPHLP